MKKLTVVLLLLLVGIFTSCEYNVMDSMTTKKALKNGRNKT